MGVCLNALTKRLYGDDDIDVNYSDIEDAADDDDGNGDADDNDDVVDDARVLGCGHL